MGERESQPSQHHHVEVLFDAKMSPPGGKERLKGFEKDEEN
jgi:hypothetical protein